MFAKDLGKRSSTSAKSSLFTGISALFSLAAISWGSATYLGSTYQDGKVQFNLDAWKWMGGVQLSLDHPELPKLAKENIDVPQFVYVAPRFKKSSFRKTSRPNLANRKLKEALDRIAMSEAHADPDAGWKNEPKMVAHFVQPVTITTQTKLIEFGNAPAEELKRVQNVQLLLQRRFLVALASPVQLDTQKVAAREVISDELTTQIPVAHKIRHRTNRRRSPQMTKAPDKAPVSEPVLNRENAFELVQATPASKNLNSVKAPKPVKGAANDLVDHISSHQASLQEPTPSQEKVDTQENPSVKSKSGKIQPLQPATSEAVIQLRNDGETVSTPPPVSPLTSEVTESAGLDTQQAVQAASPMVDTQKSDEYSNGVLVASNQPVPTFTSIQSRLPNYAASTPAPQASATPQACSEVTEAFEWNKTVSTYNISVLSSEESSAASPGQRLGWHMVNSSEHWPTLYWSGRCAIPVVSSNNAKLLAALGASTLQPDMGIVFGKIPAGFTVEFSGRAERLLLLDAQNHIVSAAQKDGDKYFALINAAPGAQIIYLASLNGNANGNAPGSGSGQPNTALGFPVLAGKATYLDLTQISAKTISGRVFDADISNAHGLSDVRVKVVGQEVNSTMTTKSGKFKLENVWTIDSYPLFLETDTGSGYTHRYRVTQKQTENLSLFRLSSAQIQTWLGQLEGGVSSESGLVIAALPGFVSSQPSIKLIPKLQPLLSNLPLTPETYVLSTEGSIQDDLKLTAETPRFISVQVPEGPVLAQVKDESTKNILWSELTMSSPGVVTLLGPY